MALWFVPPVVVPLGLTITIVAYAIYRASYAPARLQAVAVGPTAGIDMPGKLRGWRT